MDGGRGPKGGTGPGADRLDQPEWHRGTSRSREALSCIAASPGRRPRSCYDHTRGAAQTALPPGEWAHLRRAGAAAVRRRAASEGRLRRPGDSPDSPGGDHLRVPHSAADGGGEEDAAARKVGEDLPDARGHVREGGVRLPARAPAHPADPHPVRVVCGVCARTRSYGCVCELQLVSRPPANQYGMALVGRQPRRPLGPSQRFRRSPGPRQAGSLLGGLTDADLAPTCG